jgi:NAD(P)-dependent dehydrogenase (short-subunit alcohol dehydrogenase family)
MEMIHYGFSKSADLALMRALAATGVTVNAVLPGPTRTKGVENRRRLVGGSNWRGFAEGFVSAVWRLDFRGPFEPLVSGAQNRVSRAELLIG